MLNLSDDLWFGETAGAEIHLALALFRAVEYRMPLLRVMNSGISAVIQATGEMMPDSKMELFQQKAGVFEVFILKERSFYNRKGES